MALENKTILVVEDEEDGAEVVRLILRKSSVVLAVVGSGEAALDQLRQNRYDALVIDLALPEMDGFQLLEHIHSTYPDSPPTVAVTAYHTPELRQQALNAGFTAYLPKPLDKTQLVATLESLTA